MNRRWYLPDGLANCVIESSERIVNNLDSCIPKGLPEVPEFGTVEIQIQIFVHVIADEEAGRSLELVRGVDPTDNLYESIV
jgi:hypothetical protein